MAKYHINAHGNPNPCSAQSGNCPFGGDENHFSTPEEARSVYERRNASIPEPVTKPAASSVLALTPIKVSALRAGDEFQGKTVKEVKVGTKNATITTTDGKKIVVPLTETALVVREERTPEAVHAADLKYREERAERAVAQAQDRFDAAVKEMNEDLTKYGHVDSIRMANLIQAQANNHVWSLVAKKAKEDNISMLEAADRVADYYRKRHYMIKSGLSRSSSVVKNVMEDAESEAILEFLRDHEAGWY